MTSPAAPTPPPAGFTLLELLVAITLLGLLMVVLLGGLRLGARAWEVTGTRLDDSARLQVVQDFVRQRLAQALPWWAVDESGRQWLLFHGEPDRLEFVTHLPEHLGGGFHELALLLDASGGSRDLVVRWRRIDGADGSTARDPPFQKVLLAGVEELELAYFGTLGADQPAGWLDRWYDLDGLPTLLRMTVRFGPGDPRSWPELIVRPMIDVPVFATF
jgi:general secretion pathway protein J